MGSESHKIRLDTPTYREIVKLAKEQTRTIHNMMIVLLKRGIEAERDTRRVEMPRRVTEGG